MQARSADDFFLSDAAHANNARREEKMRSGLGSSAGAPFRPSNGSKILAMAASPASPEGARIYIGESSGVARTVNLDTKTTVRVFKGHTGPVTCLAVEQNPETGEDAFLYTGSWDKTIKRWDIRTGQCVTTFSGHTDFVKCILLIPPAVLAELLPASHPKPTSPKLVSSSSDRSIKLWDVATGRAERTLKGHPRGVECLAVFFSEPSEGRPQATLLSGGSEGFVHGWNFGDVLASDRAVLDSEDDRLHLQGGHETSVYGLAVLEGHFWSVSADKSARRWDSDSGFAQDLRLEHPDFVRCIAVHPTLPMVFTGCRDEEIRCWDTQTGDLVAEISGHYGDVTSLLIPPADPSKLLSASLDGTVRTWDVSPDGMRAHARAWRDKLDEAEAAKRREEAAKTGITEEEERELMELMED
ncbi:WD40-repeat-containing domain protein [Hyaloraphidium curvatum]|nr:WD40-repeat-containing domain protein [Hyaloraphidium curvatum]